MDEWKAIEAWNAYVRAHPSRRKNKPVDALAVVRPFVKPLSVWNEIMKRRAIIELLEEEEKQGNVR